MSCVVSCDTKPSDCALNSQATSPPFPDLLGEPVCLPLLLLEPTRHGRGRVEGEREERITLGNSVEGARISSYESATKKLGKRRKEEFAS